MSSIVDNNTGETDANLTQGLATASSDNFGDKLTLYKSLAQPKVFSNNDFLSRKVLLYTISGTGTFTPTFYNYQTQFLFPTGAGIPGDSIGMKLKYMHLVRGTFVLDFIMNTNAYAAGQIIIGSVQMDAPIGQYSTSADSTTITRWATSCDHVILDAGRANSAQLKIPMHLRFPYIDVSGAVDTTATQQIVVSSLVPLSSTQDGTSSPFTILVYCSMIDTEICVPIVSGAGYAYTWTAETNNTAKGPVSYPASIVETIGKNLKDVPVIGKFAYATSIAAGAVKKIASMFGFSRPMNITDIPYPHEEDYSSYSGNLRIKGLTLDPLNEIPIDNSFVGDSGDSLSLENFVLRPSVCDTFTWSTSNAITTQLYCIPVMPTWNPITDSSTSSVSLSPLCTAASLFALWTGTIKYTFAIPANRFVRGKLRFFWTPIIYGSGGVPTPAYYEITQNATSVLLDLTTSSEVTLEVPWGVQAPYIPVIPTGGSTPSTSNPCNGFIYVVVEEALITPASSYTLTCLVWISGTPDIDFQVPTNTMIQNIHKEPYLSHYSTDTLTVSTAPTLNTYTPVIVPNVGKMTNNENIYFYTFTSDSNFNPVLSGNFDMLNSDHRQDVAILHMGERFMSLRPLLKRFYPAFCMEGLSTNDYALFMSALCPDPQQTTASTTTTASPILNTPARFLSHCFVGYRGSTRWKFNFPWANDVSLPNSIDSVTINRFFAQPLSYRKTLMSVSNGNPSLLMNGMWSSGQARYAVDDSEPVFVTVPYQGVSQYQPTYFKLISTQQYGIEVYSEDPIISMQGWNSIGEDFTFVGWNGCPPSSLYSLV
jgi:hypothetical protein